MSSTVQEVGRIAVQTAGVTTPATIAASTALTLPTTAQRPKVAGILEAIVSVEIGTARWTTNGVTPTAAIGMLVQPNTYITLHGENSCAAFRIISATASITYQFYIADIH